VNHFSSDEAKNQFLKIVRAYEDLRGVEVLAFCVMSNHFHLLVRVPHRTEGLEVLLARMERAVGEEAMALVRTQLDLWTRSGLDSAIEEWRQRQVTRMFNLSEFMRCVELRFCLLRRLCESGFTWFQPLSRRAVPVAQPEKHGRRGTIWGDKFGSVLVEEENGRCGRWRRILI